MSRLYLQKGGIDHFIDLGVQLENKSYTPMAADGNKPYELPNVFFAPDNELIFIKAVSSANPLTFSIVRSDTPQLTVPATTIGVSVIQYNSSEGILNNKEYILCDGDALYYEQEPLAGDAVKLVVKITNWSRAYNSDTGGKTAISVKGLSND